MGRSNCRLSLKNQFQSSQRFQMMMRSAWLQLRQSPRPETWPLIRTKSLTTWSQKTKALERHQCHLQRQLQALHHQFQQVEDRALLSMKLLEVHFALQERGKNRGHQSEDVEMQVPEWSHILLLAIHLLSRFRQDLQMAQHPPFWKLPTSMERELDTTTGRMDQMVQFGGGIRDQDAAACHRSPTMDFERRMRWAVTVVQTDASTSPRRRCRRARWISSP